MNISKTDGEIMLRPFTLADAETHLASEDEAQQKWLSGGKSSLESVQKWIKESEEYFEKGGPVFALAVLVGDEIAGMVEANADIEKVQGLSVGDANISYGIYPNFRGKGIATKAVNLMTEFLKEKGFKRGVIRVSPDNVSSLKVPVACGFEEAGMIATKEGPLRVYTKKLSV